MSLQSEIISTEGVLLIRRDGATVAIHLTHVEVILSAVLNEPEIPNAPIFFVPPTTLDHYEVEATGAADRIYMWVGPDPFAKPELEPTRAEVEA